MPHSKLPWVIRDRWHIFTADKKNFVGSTGGHQDTRRDPVELNDEKEANANLIITAVNVMPEVKRILRCVVDEVINNPLRIQTFQDRCEHLLKKLEGIS